jgi:hypothetical protein
LRDWGNAEGTDLGVRFFPSFSLSHSHLSSSACSQGCQSPSGRSLALPLPSLTLPLQQDVLGKVTTLFDWLGKAETTFCEHGGNSRLKFKDIRSREEELSTLKKSRDSLAGRIEAHERKVRSLSSLVETYMLTLLLFCRSRR